MFHGIKNCDFLGKFRIYFHLHQTFFSTEKPFCTQTLGKFQKTLDFFSRAVAKFSSGLGCFSAKYIKKTRGIIHVGRFPHFCTTKIHLFSLKSKFGFTKINKTFHEEMPLSRPQSTTSFSRHNSGIMQSIPRPTWDLQEQKCWSLYILYKKCFQSKINVYFCDSWKTILQ